MDNKDIVIGKVIDRIDSIEDLLSDILPKTDKKHRDEVLDICSLLRQRAEMYMNEYGVNEGVEV